MSTFHFIFKCMIYRKCTILGPLDGHFVFSSYIIRFGGHPSNIDKYTIENLCTKNGAFIHPVTIILLSYLTKSNFFKLL